MPPSDKRYQGGALLPRLGPLLRSRRERLKLKGEDVALQAGITPSTLYNIEGGRFLPSLVVYTDLCRVLQFSPGRILEDRAQFTAPRRGKRR